VLALQRGALDAATALFEQTGAPLRGELRIALEKMRHVFRDLAEGEPIRDQRPGKEVARWLSQSISVSQSAWANLVDVAPRTFQRWISDTDPTRPQGEEERRLRVVAQIVNLLRHSLTGPGVVDWFGRPSAELQGRPPLDLLRKDPNSVRELFRIASRARSSSAA
jgi:hypothetical protein